MQRLLDVASSGDEEEFHQQPLPPIARRRIDPYQRPPVPVQAPSVQVHAHIDAQAQANHFDQELVLPMDVDDGGPDTNNDAAVDGEEVVAQEIVVPEDEDEVDDSDDEVIADERQQQFHYPSDSSDSGSDAEVETAEEAQAIFYRVWNAAKAASRTSHATAERFWNALRKNCKLIPLMGNRREWVCYKTVQRRGENDLPPMTIEHTFRNLETKKIFTVTQQTKFDKKKYGDPLKYKLLKTWTRISVKSAMKLLDDLHNVTYDDEEDVPWLHRRPGKRPTFIDMSYDGLKFERCNGKVMEVLAIKSLHCRRVIPIGKIHNLLPITNIKDSL